MLYRLREVNLSLGEFEKFGEVEKKSPSREVFEKSWNFGRGFCWGQSNCRKSVSL